MKRRLITVLILALMLSSLSASSAFTYSFSQVGEKYEGEGMGAMTLSLGFSPMKERPYGMVEVSALLGFSEFFRGVDMSLSTPIVCLSNDVFSYAFSNRVLWEPTVGFLAQYRTAGNRWMLGVMFSPFKFSDTNFSYEFLSPYITWSLDGERAWGIRIMKITGFLEV